MLFKKDNHPVYPLSFGNCVLEDKECHKHLVLIFQSNCKWEKHIISIIRNVTLPISCLRSFKYKLCRKALDITYKAFILPQFDYADLVWDNCAGTLSNMLKNLRLEAIRIILGAVRGTSHEKLYKESRFCSLKERRKRHKLFMFHKMINYQRPGYLPNLVPRRSSYFNPLPLSVSLRSIIMTSLDHSVSYLFFQPPPPPHLFFFFLSFFLLFLFFFSVLFVCLFVFVVILVFLFCCL